MDEAPANPKLTVDSNMANQGNSLETLDGQPQQTETTSLSWTAPEFMAHSKNAKWYFILTGVALVASALIWLLTRDKISSAFVLFGALLFGVYASRKPQESDYAINGMGVTVRGRYHSFEEFRSFGVVPEAIFSSIIFMPLKRFSQAVTIYFLPKDEEEIVGLLSDRLPQEDHRHDLIDNFMRHIHF